jgi:hypothetical protein
MQLGQGPATDRPSRVRGIAPKDDVRRFLSTFEVALYCDVTPEIVLDWIEGGLLKASCVSPEDYRVAFDDLLVFMVNIPVAKLS